MPPCTTSAKGASDLFMGIVSRKRFLSIAQACRERAGQRACVAGPVHSGGHAEMLCLDAHQSFGTLHGAGSPSLLTCSVGCLCCLGDCSRFGVCGDPSCASRKQAASNKNQLLLGSGARDKPVSTCYEMPVELTLRLLSWDVPSPY